MPSRLRWNLLVAAAALWLPPTTLRAQASDELLPTPSVAWILLLETSRDAVRMDTTRIVAYGEYTGVWLLLQRRRSLRDRSGRDLRGSAFFEEIDCDGLRTRRWEIHALGPQGDVIDTHLSNGSGWVAFQNHPVGQIAMIKACEVLARPR